MTICIVISFLSVVKYILHTITLPVCTVAKTVATLKDMFSLQGWLVEDKRQLAIIGL